MGVYFIAAGTSSKNRQKTLDRSWRLSDIKDYLPDEVVTRLEEFFPTGEKIYAWGANSDKQIRRIRQREYVVDVKNKEVMQIFTFCFFFETRHARLQELFDWDSEKSKADRRPYKYVYFLSNPQRTTRKEKRYFMRAFQETNPQWLIGQKYFSEESIVSAMDLAGARTVEEFLGLSGGSSTYKMPTPPEPVVNEYPVQETKNEDEPVVRPSWLEPVIEQVEMLKADPNHLERDHEDVVANFFEALGYRRIRDIKFQRGNIDIRIDRDGDPFITVEVKADWSLNSSSFDAISQAYNYSFRIGSRYVVVTNSDFYCVFDKQAGYKYEDQLLGSFRLTALREKDLELLELLKR